MFRTLMISALVLMPIALLSAMFVGCQYAADEPQPATVTASHPSETDALVKSYLELRWLLAADEYEGVPERFAEIRKAAQKLTDSESTEIKSLAQGIAERAAVRVADIEEAREAFKGISESLSSLVKVVPPSRDVADALHVAYCPMAKANWLQTSKELVNPYMGQKMLTCGEIKQTIELPSA